jgi:hypothetical protein
MCLHTPVWHGGAAACLACGHHSYRKPSCTFIDLLYAFARYVGWRVLRLNNREGDGMVCLQDVVKAIDAGGDTMEMVLEAPYSVVAAAADEAPQDHEQDSRVLPRLGEEPEARGVYAVARAAPQTKPGEPADYDLAQDEERESYALPALPPATVKRATVYVPHTVASPKGPDSEPNEVNVTVKPGPAGACA